MKRNEVDDNDNPTTGGAALGAGWGGRPSYQWRSFGPPDPLFFPIFGCRLPRTRAAEQAVALRHGDEPTNEATIGRRRLLLSC